MGLDMWFMSRPKQPKAEEVHYWRKHNALHHWFEEYARDNGLVDPSDDFNCVEVQLTTELLDKLEQDIRKGNLEPIGGFFFGVTDYDPKEYMEDDLAAITKARQGIANGDEVFYTSWW